MALVNPTTGEYLKIFNIHIELKDNMHNYQYIIFADEAQRQRYEIGLSEYETVKRGIYNSSVQLDTAINASANSNKSIKNNVLTSGYDVMKADEIFSTWIDG